MAPSQQSNVMLIDPVVRSRNSGRRSNGFTLIEVLIALIIVGMALPALMLNVQAVSGNTAYMEEKTFAYWVAENRLQELKLRRHVTKQLAKTKENETVDYGGREWVLAVDYQSTIFENVFEVQVRVGLEQGQWLATLTGYLYE